MVSRTGFSPLERRALLTLLSLIRDREPDRYWRQFTDVKVSEVYDAMYRPGDRPYEVERRNQRQATRRALGRLQADGLVYAFALAWVNIEDHAVLRWQGGGTRKREGNHRTDTPRWKLVGLTDIGITAAEALERERAVNQ